MPKSIYIINPREAAPFIFSSEVLAAANIGRFPILADLTVPTLAGFVPAGWSIEICDERSDDADFETKAEVIAITAKVSQRARMKTLAAEFRKRGKLVLVGGPHVSLWPQDLRGHADVLVIGEMEDIAAGIFADIEAGCPKPEYRGGKPDLRASPVPRWDLYPLKQGMAGQVQTSRGCPFECEFCDVIQYLGRKQRWKEPGQVIAELDQLYRLGCRDVLLADDNFTIVRKRARALLEMIGDWNGRQPDGRMRLVTQLSVDAARDLDLLNLAVQAGLDRCFIGVETPNEASLKEVQKRQNMRVDLAGEIRRIASTGLMPLCGMIVGFDHDGQDIFERQAKFIAAIPAPVIQVGLLVAPYGTPLWDRIKAEGRLVEAGYIGEGNLTDTNIAPLLMSPEALRSGLRWLLNEVFSPENWFRRLELFAELAPANINRRGLQVFSLVEARLAGA
ncbi:MAG: radical SAM protein, partial [Parvibaculaceae bacterium]